MLTVDEALNKIASHVRPLPVARVPLSEALSCLLAEDVASDIDSPSHDKSVVDGYAVRSVDFARSARGEAAEPVELAVLEEVTAGQMPQRSLASGYATRIMTGAPIPHGADAVVMVEQTSHAEEPGSSMGVVTFHTDQITAGQNIKRRATSIRTGQVVLRAGATIRATEIGLLAEVGRPGVAIVSRPRVAVLSTGNELVAAELLPAAGQIRNSNGPMLLAAARSAGAAPIDLGIGRDDVDALRRLIEQGLEQDVLLLSGGVSAGKLDLVPGVLKELGVREVFHKVSVKPGKPLWFGVAGGGDTADCLVFGLPGNPVSSLVGFELFVRPVLAALAGHPWQPPATVTAELVQAFTTHGNRSTYFPARLDESGERPTVELLAWQGSGDLRTITEANCLAIFAPGETEYAAGASIPVMRI